ncbi:hypothetical protein DH2020_012042 [Rehmannia glutinosa]|uniref:Cytochrome P450 protein n=1 Tax=Rehmannia glutinosa TaxID=99300 RepID=A0ABR0XFD4_REHGL
MVKAKETSQPCFSWRELKAMIASVDSMLERWGYHEKSKEIEISKEFKLLTSDVISRTAFGSSYLEGKNIFEMLTKLSVLIAKNAFKIKLFGLEKIWRSNDEIESDKIEQSLRDSIVSMVKKREDNVKTGKAENFGSDFLGSLLKVHHDLDPKSRISVDDIVDECKVFYIAGHETTSSLLGWIVVLLSIHTEWQEKARKRCFNSSARKSRRGEGIARLKILSMIVNEALRLYSPVVHISRRAHRKTKLGKYEVPANVDVNISPLSLHMNPKIWGQDVQIFNPQRFADGLGKATNGNLIAFLPFGAGPRRVWLELCS